MAKATLKPDDAATVPTEATEAVITASDPIQVIYYGPNLPGGLLAQFSVFIGGLPTHIIEQYPETEKAFAPVAETPAVLASLNDPHSIESANVARIRASFTKGA